MMFELRTLAVTMSVSNLESVERGSTLFGLWRFRRWLAAYVGPAFGLYAAALALGTLLTVQPPSVLGLVLAFTVSA
jgi:hypothetical protein